MKVSAAGLGLIKEFEGLSLMAYKCPAGVISIGYGTTVYPDRTPVRMGDTCTESEAARFLAFHLTTTERGVSELVTVPITQGQFDALVSFAYNVGLGALRESTLLRKLNEADYLGAAGEFARWNKADGTELPGLTRRRRAETALFQMQSPQQEPHSMTISPEKFLDFWRFFDEHNPNHRKAVWMLAGVIPPAALSDEAEWVKTYRTPVPGSADTRPDTHADMSGHVSENFTWGEVWNRDPERITHDPEILANVRKLADKLEWIRFVLQTPLVVNSWRRSEAANRACSGSKSSLHLTGLAADVVPTAVPLKVLQNWALANWPGGVGIYADFCHLDLGPKRTWHG